MKKLTAERYARQTPVIGDKGEEKLSQARVLIVGVGGLGSPIALYLAAAGVGHIGLMDDDLVSISNLQRQVLYTESQIGMSKAQCAKERLVAINSTITVDAIDARLTNKNALQTISQYDIVVDGCDNIATRHTIDSVCRELCRPYVYGAINATSGQVAVFNFRSGVSYGDIFPEGDCSPTQNPSPAVIGLTPAIIGSVQAMEVIKIITGVGDVLDGRLWSYNLLTNESSCYNIAPSL